MRYFDLLKKRAEKRKRYLDNLDFYLKEIAEFFKEKLTEIEIYSFGSILTGDFDPESDIDILIISSNAPRYLYQRAKLIAELKSKIGFVNPFEIHLITPEEHKDWYSHFIKKKSEIGV